VAAGAAVVLVLSALALLARGGDGGVPTEVLGRQVPRSTTTAADRATSDSTTTLVVTTTVLAPVPIDQVTTTTALAPPAVATTTTRPPTSPADPHGRVVERADTTASFDYRADGGGAMTTTDNGQPRDPFVFKTLGSDTDHDGACELRADMTNQTARDITFPDGLVLRFILSKDGQQWRTVELRFPDTQSLAPGASLEVESATPLDQQYGHYDVGGEVTVDYP
jgi:hypothetical protein